MPQADFSVWTRESLEDFARQAADENRELRVEQARMQADIKAALEGFRRLALELETLKSQPARTAAGQSLAAPGFQP
jgi:hypothetical protein